MKSKILYIFSGFLLLASTLVRAGNNTEITTGTLECGDAVLTGKTTAYYPPLGDFVRQVLDQRVTFTNRRNGKQKQIKTDGKYVIKHLPEKRKVLDASISNWYCMKSNKGKKYILIQYYCTFGEEKGFCDQAGDVWNRYLKEDGTFINKGPRRKRITRENEIILKSLGIDEYTNDVILKKNIVDESP